ncbi:MAG: lactonase family protein [Acidobacteriaceae bacterium]
MTRPTLWNRRIFMQRLGYLSGLGVVRPPSAWSFSGKSHLMRGLRTTENTARPLFAYVGSWGHGIQVFAVEKNRWRLSQTIASDKPSCLALHPNLKFMYAVNEIDEYEGLPTGTVEAYSINARNGRLNLLNRQPLSLSAIAPRYLVVSPDGSKLIVAVHGGGAYNVLPIRTGGFLERVSGILKEVGSGPDRERQNTAHPQMVLFDTTQDRLLSADLGSDRLNVFTLAEDRLTMAHRYSTEPGSGPRLLALHSSGRVLYVTNELDASISCFGYDAASGRILDRLHHHAFHTAASLKGAAATAMAMHPSGNFLYTSSSCYRASSSTRSRISAWCIDPPIGKLDLLQEADMGMQSSSVESMVTVHDALFVLSQTEGISRLDLDPTSGLIDYAVQIAKVSAPKSMVLQYL